MKVKLMKLDPNQMAAAADQASELLKSLGNRHRLLILCQLTEGERSVGDLAAFLGLRDSTVSQHLSLLRRDGLVQARRDGQTIWYSIASDPGAPRAGDAVRAVLQADLLVRTARPQAGVASAGQSAMSFADAARNIAGAARRALTQVNEVARRNAVQSAAWETAPACRRPFDPSPPNRRP